jgi:hypothetical protein
LLMTSGAAFLQQPLAHCVGSVIKIIKTGYNIFISRSFYVEKNL